MVKTQNDNGYQNTDAAINHWRTCLKRADNGILFYSLVFFLLFLFQVGTVVDNPVDFYSSRIPKKQRKRTIVEELLADAEFRR